MMPAGYAVHPGMAPMQPGVNWAARVSPDLTTSRQIFAGRFIQQKIRYIHSSLEQQICVLLYCCTEPIKSLRLFLAL